MVDPTLAAFRRSTDNIDMALIGLLAERFSITQEVGRHKARHALPAADPECEAQQLDRLKILPAESGLNPDFSVKFLRFILNKAIRHHELAKRTS